MPTQANKEKKEMNPSPRDVLLGSGMAHRSKLKLMKMKRDRDDIIDAMSRGGMKKKKKKKRDTNGGR